MSLERHIIKEFITSFAAISLLLTTLLIATEISDTLNRVLTGQYSDNAIWLLIGLQVPVVLAEILPASYFISLLMVLYRQMQDNERAIYHAVGKSDLNLLNSLLLITAIPITLLVLLLTNFIGPLANKQVSNFIVEQRNRPITDIVKPFEFIEIPQVSATLHAGGASSAQEQLHDVFAVQQEDKEYRVIVAEALTVENDVSKQYFQFNDGTQSTFSFNETRDSEVMQFSTMQLLINEGETVALRARHPEKTTIELLSEENSRRNRLITLNRFYAAMYIPLFCLIAVALTKYKPRAAKVGAMIIGITTYILTNFTFRTISGAFSKNDWSLFLTPWWLFILIALFCFHHLRKQY